MRWLLAIAAMAGLVWLCVDLSEKREAASQVMAKVDEMARRGSAEAGEVGYRVVAARYPFSPHASRARRELFLARRGALEVPPDAGGAGLVRGDRALRDPLWVRGDPYVGALGVAIAAAFLALLSLVRSGGRSKGTAFLLLLLVLGAMAVTQTGLGQHHLVRANETLATWAYAHFPWIGALALFVASLLLMIPARVR